MKNREIISDRGRGERGEFLPKKKRITSLLSFQDGHFHFEMALPE
jgi:hypothetical protein